MKIMVRRKHTLTVIITMIALLSFSLILFLFFQKTKNQPSKNPFSTKPIEKTTTLYFQPVVLRVNPTSIGTPKDVSVYAYSGNSPITGIQMELTYDPTYISNVVVSPPSSNSFFGGDGKQIVLVNKVNQNTGRINYAIAITPSSPAPKGRGLIATIRFNAKGLLGAKTKMDFTLNSVVTQENESQSVLKNASPLYIEFLNTQSIPLPASASKTK